MKNKAIKVIILTICIGLSFGLYFYFAVDQRLSRIVNSVLSSFLIGSLMMLGIYLRKYLNFITQVQYVKVMLMLLLLIISAIIGTELTLFLQALIFKSGYHFFDGQHVYILNIIVVLIIGIPIYVNEEWKTTIGSQLLNQQFQLLKLEQQNTMFELELLRSKINPHFLYNVHNSIAGLISSDPVKAEAMILLLSKFFRFTLNKDSATFHSIADEIDIIRTYLDLQLIRYEDRLNYTINVDQGLLGLQFPSYILQPLVENSIKHGIEKITEKGIIAIEITAVNHQLIIRVIDNGPPFPNLPGTGVGLQIINNKLRLLYQERFTIEFQNFPKKYVELILPQNHPDGISR